LAFAEDQFDWPAPITLEPSFGPAGAAVSSRVEREIVSVPSGDQQTDGSGGVFVDLDSNVVGVGDLVFIRYDDQPDRRLSVRLSNTENNPNNGIVHVSQPLATAILGASLDEPITVNIGNRSRTAVIESIEKSRPVQTLAAD
jgi:hypothetical protein